MALAHVGVGKAFVTLESKPHHRSFGVIRALPLVLALSCYVDVPAPAKPRDEIDAKTKDTVSKVGDLYKDAKSLHANLSFHVTVEMDGEKKCELRAEGTVDFQRPLSFALHTNVINDSSMGLDVVCDGKTLITHSRRQKQYTERQPGALSQIGRSLLALGGPTTGMLFQNVLAEDPADALFENVTDGKFIGSEKIGDLDAHHLAFKQPNLDWELWVAASGSPFVLKAKSVAPVQGGKVTTVEMYTNWKLNPTFDKDLFQFKPPPDANKVDRLDGQRGG
jgi:hypothetical protein